LSTPTRACACSPPRASASSAAPTDLPQLNVALEAETDDATRDRLAWAIERIDDE
jgi:hypothetical protein